jgi:hypothetical protein
VANRCSLSQACLSQDHCCGGDRENRQESPYLWALVLMTPCMQHYHAVWRFQRTTEALPHLRERAYVTAPTPHLHMYRSLALHGTTEALQHLRERAYVTAPTPHLHIYRVRLRRKLGREWRRCRKHSSRLQRTARLLDKGKEQNKDAGTYSNVAYFRRGISQADDERYGQAAKRARRLSSVIMSSQTTSCCKLSCATCYYRRFKVRSFKKKEDTLLHLSSTCNLCQNVCCFYLNLFRSISELLSFL